MRKKYHLVPKNLFIQFYVKTLFSKVVNLGTYFVYCSDNDRSESTDDVFQNGHSLNTTTQLTNTEIV